MGGLAAERLALVQVCSLKSRFGRKRFRSSSSNSSHPQLSQPLIVQLGLQPLQALVKRVARAPGKERASS